MNKKLICSDDLDPLYILERDEANRLLEEQAKNGEYAFDWDLERHEINKIISKSKLDTEKISSENDLGDNEL